MLLGDLDDVLRRRTLLALDDRELHPLALGERTEALVLNRRMMDEAVLLAVLWGDEAEALGVVEPLHRAGRTHSTTPLGCCHRSAGSGTDRLQSRGGFAPTRAWFPPDGRSTASACDGYEEGPAMCRPWILSRNLFALCAR